ncbi:MAG: hypothetical protein JO211_11570 [Acidobacteriaceae bacterium]|nr:hypothetical protein [Acidobacteriaceae bacterium]
MLTLIALCLLESGTLGMAHAAVPELSPVSGGGALILLASAFFVLRGRARK